MHRGGWPHTDVRVSRARPHHGPPARRSGCLNSVDRAAVFASRAEQSSAAADVQLTHGAPTINKSLSPCGMAFGTSLAGRHPQRRTRRCWPARQKRRWRWRAGRSDAILVQAHSERPLCRREAGCTRRLPTHAGTRTRTSTCPRGSYDRESACLRPKARSAALWQTGRANLPGVLQRRHADRYEGRNSRAQRCQRPILWAPCRPQST